MTNCFGLECLDIEESSYSQLPGSLSPDYKYLHAVPHQLSLPSQPYLTVSDILLVSLNHRWIFLLHTNTLVCVKADI